MNIQLSTTVFVRRCLVLYISISIVVILSLILNAKSLPLHKERLNIIEKSQKLRQINEDLEIKVYKKLNLNHLEKKSTELGMKKPKNITYIPL